MSPQHNTARPDALSIRIATTVRGQMFAAFMRKFAPAADDTILDIGVTSNQSDTSSNYLEALCPHKDRSTAAGIDDASFLKTLYSGMKLVFANAPALPFADTAPRCWNMSVPSPTSPKWSANASAWLAEASA